MQNIISFSLLGSCITLIDHPAVVPDLPLGARERADVPHLDHSCGKIRRELAGAGAVSLHQGVSGSVAEQLLIRVKEALEVDQVLEVVIVEGGRSLEVQRCQVAVA